MLEQNSKENPEYRGKSTSGTLFGILLILMVIAGMTFFVKPLSDQVATIKADVAAKNTNIQELSARLEQYKQAEKDLGLATEVQKLEISKSVPMEVFQDEVIKDLITIAGDYDIKLNSIGFGKGGSAQEGIGTLTINASFEGNYSDLINFLQGIEQNRRLFIVPSISVQITKLSVSEISRANFSLSILAFYQEAVK